MNNKIKIALALVGAGSILAWRMNRRKGGKKKTFTAPDGNTYQENQIYRTFDQKIYKNGKQIQFETPEMSLNNSVNHPFEGQTDNLSKNYNKVNKEINYHQKGVRHH